jgi:hypothetical protein
MLAAWRAEMDRKLNQVKKYIIESTLLVLLIIEVVRLVADDVRRSGLLELFVNRP